MPGAFTPTCHSQAPGYIEKHDQFKAKGINEIYIVTVNDVFVTKCVLYMGEGSHIFLAALRTYARSFFSCSTHKLNFHRAWKENLAPNGTRKSILIHFLGFSFFFLKK